MKCLFLIGKISNAGEKGMKDAHRRHMEAFKYFFLIALNETNSFINN